VNVTPEVQPAVVSEYDITPVIDIYVSVQGRDFGGLVAEINKEVEAMQPALKKGQKLTLRGQVNTMKSSYTGLLIGLAAAIVLVYFLIVVNFQSWLDPLIIVSALPAALAGIAWMLFLTGTHLSVPALTGAIMTMGVATANSILLVSFALQRLRAGIPPLSAALEAGSTRIRPVLMTAAAMIIGMLPMALGLGEGSEQNAPLGRAVIGGLLFATVSTLFFVPVLFASAHRYIARRQRAIFIPGWLRILFGLRALLHLPFAERELVKASPDIERSYLEGLASEGPLASSFGPRERERTLARARQTNDSGASSS
jgi:multidrug efflux pump subunit AcrB